MKSPYFSFCKYSLVLLPFQGSTTAFQGFVIVLVSQYKLLQLVARNWLKKETFCCCFYVPVLDYRVLIDLHRLCNAELSESSQSMKPSLIVYCMLGLAGLLCPHVDSNSGLLVYTKLFLVCSHPTPMAYIPLKCMGSCCLCLQNFFLLYPFYCLNLQ